MIAVFTFNLSDLKASIGKTSIGKTDQWIWHGRCRAETGGSFSQLNSELSVTNISECDLVEQIIANFSKQPAALELEEELSTAKKDGTIDAMIITHYPEDKTRSPFPKEFLGITIGLRPRKYELFRTFVTLHFGRPNLIGRISFSFVGFPNSSQSGLRIPSYSEFLKGRPYFAQMIVQLRSAPIRYLEDLSSLWAFALSQTVATQLDYYGGLSLFQACFSFLKMIM